MTPAEYAAGKAKDYKVIDVGLAPSIRGSSLCKSFSGKRRNRRFGQRREASASYVQKENVHISYRTVCVSMDIRILWYWKAHSSLMM